MEMESKNLLEEEKNILSYYLPSLPEKDQKDFVEKYKKLSNEDKVPLLQRIASMLPEYRTPKQNTNQGLSFGGI